MDSSMFDGIGKMLVCCGIALFVLGGIASVIIWKASAWRFQHLMIVWR